MRNKLIELKRNMDWLSATAMMLVATVASFQTLAGENEPDPESKSYLPLRPGSTYSYNFTYKERKGTETVVVKSTTQAGVELFYFILENEANNPQALLLATSFGLGVYIKQE